MLGLLWYPVFFFLSFFCTALGLCIATRLDKRCAACCGVFGIVFSFCLFLDRGAWIWALRFLGLDGFLAMGIWYTGYGSGCGDGASVYILRGLSIPINTQYFYFYVYESVRVADHAWTVTHSSTIAHCIRVFDNLVVRRLMPSVNL